MRVSEWLGGGTDPLRLGLLGWIQGREGERVQRSGEKHGIRTRGKWARRGGRKRGRYVQRTRGEKSGKAVRGSGTGEDTKKAESR